MGTDNLKLIRRIIASAVERDGNTGDLERFVAALAPKLHRAIALPQTNADDALRQFIVAYVSHVPDFLEALGDVFERSGLHNQGRTFLSIAEDYFLRPPEAIRPAESLPGLLDAAYLAHRLIEEINDRLLVLCGCPFTQMDMTLSNIIVHDILGEKFANQLDMAVHYAVESLFDPSKLSLYEPLLSSLKGSREHWHSSDQYWPCLAGDSAIALHFDCGVSSKAVAH